QLYYNPSAAMSEIMDNGSWLFAAAGVVILSIGLGVAINSHILDTYAVSNVDYYSIGGIDRDFVESEIDMSLVPEGQDGASTIVVEKRPFPVLGNMIFWLFSFFSSFITPLIVLSLFYFPGTIILGTVLGRLGNAGVVVRRDYATFATCGLFAWTAAHLPFVIVGFLLSGAGPDGSVFLGLWIASGIYFGVLMVFALRTVFGVEYVAAIITTAFSWLFFSLGIVITAFIGPWLFSPFLIIIAVLYFGGFISGEVSGLGNSMRRKRDFKRHLHNATVNPNDADAHVQLGLIYAQRRQNDKALEHFERAFEIDNEEIDANFELGKIAREKGDLQRAIEHFSVVVEQNDKFSLNEIWREIGRTYLDADMLDEAEGALEKFVTRRAFDSEGLYFYGLLLKKKKDEQKAKEMFERAVEAVKTAPYHRKNELMKWSRLAAKEIG
ncbi:MAG: tetratricopeptide repeat protein, partial [Acidobacteriota bacterium]|nr:tetratricopeptide repeat protein [Acidobacteriota bacterium]